MDRRRRAILAFFAVIIALAIVACLLLALINQWDRVIPISSPPITASSTSYPITVPSPSPVEIVVEITSTPTPTPTPSSDSSTYIVQQGDTYAKIAQRYGITVSELWAANPGIWDINRIYAGQVINVPPPSGSITPPLRETPNATQTLQAAYADIDADFQNSNIAYNRPERMHKGTTTDIELLLNPSMSQAALGTKVAERGEYVTSTAEPGVLVGPSGEEITITTANIEITDKMRAKLFSKAPNAFEIQEVSEFEQVISPDNTTIWRWSVTAKTEGTQTLELVLYRLIKYGNEDHWTELETYRDDIIVEVSLIDRIKSLDWKWIIGIIVTALLIPAFWRLIDSRKKDVADSKKKTTSRKRQK
jgi:LysM repeat protein